MRNAIVAGIIAIVVVVMVWAGIHNLHTRRAEEAAARTQPMTITTDKPGATVTSNSTESGQAPDLRGKPAPNFSLKTLDGKTLTLADLKGKAVLVNFWATWCAPCKIEMPWFEEFRKKYEAQGFEIVGIDEDDDASSAKMKDTIGKTVKSTGVSYPIVLGNTKVSDAYGGLDVLPATYFVGRDGTVLAQTMGLAPKSDAEANVQKIVASK